MMPAACYGSLLHARNDTKNVMGLGLGQKILIGQGYSARGNELGIGSSPEATPLPARLSAQALDILQFLEEHTQLSQAESHRKV